MPRNFQRTDRVSDAMQRELALLIQREMADPRVQWVTISAVKLTRDMAYAKVYFTLMDEAEKESVAAVLNSASGFLRGLLAKKISLRHTPQLEFLFDETLMKANAFCALISQVV
jgi:ribosome-binding factor A